MEMTERLDFIGVKGVRKARTFMVRKPNSGESHTSFLNEQDHSLPSASLPSDPRNVINSDKGWNDATIKHLNSHSHGDYYKRRLGNSNSFGRFEGKDDLGRSLESSCSMANRDDDSVPERVEIKGIRREFANLNGKRLGRKPDDDRNYDKGESKSQGYEHSRSSEKSSREKSHKDSKDLREYSIGEKVERERSRFRKTSKLNSNANDLDLSKRIHEGGMERKDSHNPSHVTGGMHSEVKTTTYGRTSDRRDPDMKVLVKSLLQQDDLPSQEDWLTKAKVKVGGVTHTAHANTTGNVEGIKKRCAEGSSVSAKPPRATEGRRRHQRLILQENSDDEDDLPVMVEIQESPKKKPQVNTWASFTKMDNHPVKEDQKGQLADNVTHGKQAGLTNSVLANQPVRKSSRTPKKRILDGEHNVDDDSKKTLQNKSSRTMKKCARNGEYDEDKECETRQCRSSRIPQKRLLDAGHEEDDEVQQHKRRWKRSKYQTDSEHMYHEDSEEVDALGDEDVEMIDVDPKGLKKRSKRKQGVGNSTVDDNREVTLTARQRTMLSCKGAGSEEGANLIEFPEGLPQTSQRKPKEELLEVEQKLKKTEAAQRRKMQSEKAANAAQAEAINKILGKDLSKKKREDKLQKQRDNMAQKKDANAMLLASNGVRWVMGPTGTVVTFSESMGLPSIFNNPPCRYPPPREKCAGPSCNNTYKYRDSRTNLPLCSLKCYRAIHGP